ncbi:MAG TPA: cytochrome C, partial [Bradyrhizobium sp.]|nr:cytochrome C [Bradyrhizobium sp.]
MAVSRHQTRRDVIRGVAAVAAAALARPSLAQAAPRIAVIGGGFG